MSMPTGIVQYTIGTVPVTGYGVSWSTDELDAALSGPVSVIVFDEPGKTDISELLSGIAETDFEKSQVEKILEATMPPEDWRVGEALAESYLVHHKNCFFPWPDGRDERKAGSSLPGADLVGFQNDDDEDYFVFGEVKTSGENTYPPGAVHGRTGLKQQLDDLRDCVSIKNDLVRYIGHRAVTASWKSRFQNAAKKYLQSNTSIRVFGVLVRDVKPNLDDLRVRVKKLAKEAHADMKIELVAVYLPVGSISTLSSKIMSYKKGDAE